MAENSNVLSENVSRTLGKAAQRENILAAKIVSDIVKTTLGPRGMDKMLVDKDGNITVTNDGVTILEEIEIEHPAAKMMVEIAKTQEAEVGDGTTTAVLLAGKLLENSEKLLDRRIHPTVIEKGYKLAAEQALKVLDEVSIKIENRETLINIAQTAMTGKGAEGNKEVLSSLIIEAVEAVSEGNLVDLENIKIEKIKGEEVSKSELIRGLVLNKERANKEMPSRVQDARILLVDFPLEIKSPEQETRISISSPEQLESFIKSEELFLRELTSKIKNSEANVVFCQKGIDDLAQYYLAKSGIFACRRVNKSDMEKIARATSSRVLSNIEDISPGVLGRAEMVQEIKEGEESLIFIRGCANPKAVSLVLRGSTSHVLDEIERAVKDGLGDIVAALNSKRVVPGGGAIEIELAKRLRNFSKSLSGREQLAAEEFANSLESIPETLAENAGLDPIDILTELRRRHELNEINYGLNLFSNKIEDVLKAGIIEPLKVKKQAISSAVEVTNLILRVDDILLSKKKEESKTEREHSELD